MREHLFFPKPTFARYVCYPDFVGGYSNYPEHTVRREYRTTEQNMDKNYNLHIVLDGKGYVMTEGNRYELTRGHGFLYGPGLRQDYHSDSHQPWNIRWAHFFGTHLEELLNGKGLDEPWLFALSDLDSIETLLNKMLELGRSFRLEDEHAVSATLYELLTRLQTGATQINDSADPSLDKIRSAANYIRAHSAETITLERAAAIAGYSTPYFSRKFSQTFGMSFPDFLLEARLLHAKRLLASTNLSIKQIALETGFSQSSYFSTCFRRVEGMSPAQFRAMRKTD